MEVAFSLTVAITLLLEYQSVEASEIHALN